MRTSDHENFDFWVWGICPGEQISSEIHHSLPGPACFGVPGPSLQEEEEMAVSECEGPWLPEGWFEGWAIAPPQLQGCSLK